MSERRTYTVIEAAEILGISRATAYKLARSGELPGVIPLGIRGKKGAGRYVVSRELLDRVCPPTSAGEAPS